MIEFSESQRRTVASGLAALSAAIVLAFVALVAWGLLKALSFASPALVPVIMGFFLSLFFKPYYLLWRKLVRNPTLALLAMLATVFVPLGIIVWHAGSLIVEQALHLMRQGPELANQVMHWFRGTFPQLDTLLHEVGVQYEDIGYIYTRYGPSALKAGAGALKCLQGVFSVLVSLIFFVFFLMTPTKRGGAIVDHMPFLNNSYKSKWYSKRIL